MKWTAEEMGDQSGKVAIVTGANSGIGFEAAKLLANKGAEVVLACRSRERGEAAVDRIRKQESNAKVSFMPLDLADLDQVRELAGAFSKSNDRLDLLVNNAGVMMCPAGKTKQGFETQLGINHLGHFALTGLLFDLLASTPKSRVVTISSQMHRPGQVEFDDLHFDERAYDETAAYAQSKLANLLFTFELQRRLEAAKLDTLAVAAHPGWTQTDLQRHKRLFRLFNPFFAMSPAQGALPTLRAATAPDVTGGDYYGPHAFYEMRGYPKRVGSSERAQNRDDAARLWQVSQELTGVQFLSDLA